MVVLCQKAVWYLGEFLLTHAPLGTYHTRTYITHLITITHRSHPHSLPVTITPLTLSHLPFPSSLDIARMDPPNPVTITQSPPSYPPPFPPPPTHLLSLDIARMDPPNPVTHRRTYVHTFDAAMQQQTAACISQCSAW